MERSEEGGVVKVSTHARQTEEKEEVWRDGETRTERRTGKAKKKGRKRPKHESKKAMR